MTQGSGWDGILEPGETILWQGQPVPDIVWRDMISGRLPIGIIFTAFSTVWISVAVWIVASIDAPILFRLFFPLGGLPFLAIGLYMLVGHLFWDARRRRGTWYTLTDRHAFVATDIFGRRKLDRYPIADMAALELVDGSPGDVNFGSVTHHMPRRAPGPHKSRNRLGGSTTVKTGFRHITEARKVWRMIRDRQAATTAATCDMQEDGTP
ncbi:hypothetical protein [Roseicyclus mahoneyensis]|uniref:PH (Pleckstrin Homology) domain-containing protein n=1 Tax=Roseicyclus mahoneyensis TaxID=164332 RepID=A0A316GKF1_9RHOB|nr:hypothetical protein [Roseicyclus mahoneyensis]PWK59886.1 hypothetical protein C7455_106174 [Roseicyclus mahoneyensis]